MSDNSILAVFGRKGSGKSTLVREIVREHERVIALDTLGEYPLRVVEGFEPCLAAMEAAEHSRRFRLSLRCPDTADMLELLEVAYELPRTLVVVEETSFYCSPSYLPPQLSTLVRYGRHRSIDQIYVARRPSEIHRDLTAQADVIVSFLQTEPRDVDYLTRFAGEDALRVRSLKPFEPWAWSPSGTRDKFPLALLARTTTPGPAPGAAATGLDAGADNVT